MVDVSAPRRASTQVVSPGKKGGLFDGCEFNLLMECSADYPSKAPVVKFVTKMFHPNIYADVRSRAALSDSRGARISAIISGKMASPEYANAICEKPSSADAASLQCSRK